MISTVTTSTVTTVTTITLLGSLTLIIVLSLLFFLILKETLSVSTDTKRQALSKALNVAIVPLTVSFVFVAIVNIMEVLN